jgi:hypothetical protein
LKREISANLDCGSQEISGHYIEYTTGPYILEIPTNKSVDKNDGPSVDLWTAVSLTSYKVNYRDIYSQGEDVGGVEQGSFWLWDLGDIIDEGEAQDITYIVDYTQRKIFSKFWACTYEIDHLMEQEDEDY